MLFPQQCGLVQDGSYLPLFHIESYREVLEISKLIFFSYYSQTCRQRKLKCDEIKPECGQCRKASRQCIPSDGVVFRHQQNASMNGSEDVIPGEKGGRLGAFYAYRNTFDESSVWVDVPKKGTYSSIVK